ncbi:MAG: MFS transporter [Candidatus Thorarchaeota archaeon]|nr:MFS transporter [Candidatus Thorarchaeota archaeon]
MKATHASYFVLTACTLTHFMHHLYTGVLSPFLPLIRDELSLSLTEAGLATSAAVFTMTITHLLVGVLADKGWREIFISATVLFASVVVYLTSFATTFLYLLTCQLLLGISSAGYHPCAFPILADHFPREDRAKATGIQAMGGLLGTAVVPGLGVFMLALVGTWQNSLSVLAIVGFLLVIPVFMMIRGEDKSCYWKTQEDGERDGEQGWTRNFVLLVILAGLRSIPFRCTSLLMPLYLVVSYGYSPLWAGSLTSLMLGSGLVAEILSSPVSDRTRRTPHIILSSALMTPCLLLLNMSLEPVVLAAVLIGVGFFYYWGVPANAAFETEVSPKNAKGTAFGLLFSFGAFPGAVAPTVFGYLGDVYGLQASVLFLASTTALAAVVAALLREERGPLK